MDDLYEILTNLDSDFSSIFDLKNKEEKRRFKLLKDAYIDARYSDKYKITREELTFLENKIIQLKSLISSLSKKEIELSLA